MIIVSFSLLLVVMVTAIMLGNLLIPLEEVLKVLGARLKTDMAVDSRYSSVVWDIRFPRVCLAAAGGAMLAAAGAVFQGVFRNPLVEPYILGVSSGAACGAGIAIVYLGGMVSIGIMSFGFAVAAMLISYGIAHESRKNTVSKSGTGRVGGCFCVFFSSEFDKNVCTGQQAARNFFLADGWLLYSKME